MHAANKTCKCGIRPGFGTQGRRHQSPNRGISGPIKRNDVLLNFFLNIKLYFMEWAVLFDTFVSVADPNSNKYGDRGVGLESRVKRITRPLPDP